MITYGTSSSSSSSSTPSRGIAFAPQCPAFAWDRTPSRSPTPDQDRDLITLAPTVTKKIVTLPSIPISPVKKPVNRPAAQAPTSTKSTPSKPSPRPASQAPTPPRSTPSKPAPRMSSAKMTSTQSTPLARPTRAKEEEEGKRSTRSSGSATFFQPLEGAPEPVRKSGRQPVPSSKKRATPAPAAAAPASKAKARAAPRKRSYLDVTSESDASEDEDDERAVLAAQKKRVAAPVKTAPPAAKKTKTTTIAASTPTASRVRSYLSTSETEDEDEDEDEISLVPTSTRRAAAAATVPPARKSATRTKVLPLDSLPSPVRTPETKRVLASASAASPFPARTAHSPTKPSPLKKVARRAAANLSEDDEAEEKADEVEADHVEEAQQEEAEQPALPTPASTPSKTPRKGGRTARSSTTTPVSTPSSRRTSSSSITPRSSSRLQRLPPSVAEIANAPANLRSRLVGFHMEDEGYGAAAIAAKGDEEEEQEEAESEGEEREQEHEQVLAQRRKEKGKERALQVEVVAEGGQPQQLEELEDTEMKDDFTLPTPPASFFPLPTPPSSPSPSDLSTYTSSPLALHLSSTLSLLSGARPPRPFLAPTATSTLPAREEGISAFPCLEGGYDEWERPLRQSLGEVVERGMGNAMMVLGPRGVGKTMLIDRTLSILACVHSPSAFAVVRLSGLVHTTDRLALRSIAVQLQQQGFAGGDFEIDEGDFSSNSATMTTLLRLLEPSSSMASTASSSSPSSASNDTKSKPLILVVDEFDLFAQHPRQSFLYCLLDIVQGNRRRGGVGVVGVSSRVDCLSLLEKRVRSRCQSHVLQMMPSSSLSSLTSLGKRLMQSDVRAWELTRGEGSGEGQWAKKWNDEVERFWAGKKVKEYMERVWMVGGNVPTELRSVLSHLFYQLSYRLRLSPPTDPLTVPRLTIDLLPAPPSSSPRDPVLSRLSILELTALIGAKHLTASTSDRQSGFNFEMVWEGYAEHARRASLTSSAGGLGVGMKTYSKAAMREAFDSLRTHELLLPRSSSSTSSSTATAGVGGPVTVPSLSYLAPTARDPFKLYRLVPWAKDVDAEVAARGAECPLGLRRWCKNWLD
ncbi:hypothetical protein JCM11251_000653 [Rhodosporidiobolus azoricus]